MWLFDFPFTGKLLFDGKVFFDEITCPDCGEVLVRRGWLDYRFYLQDVFDRMKIVKTNCRNCGSPFMAARGARVYHVWLDP